jgi:hypothetical protein
MPRALKLAILCGSLPLLVGTIIYISWRLTRVEWLMGAGLVTLFVGLVLFLVGAICLSMRSTKVSDADAAVQRKLLSLRKLAWTVLVVNFPAACFFAWSAIEVATRYTLAIVNEQAMRIDSFIVSAPGVKVDLGPIPANGRRQKHLHFPGEGSLSFATQVGQTRTNGVIDEYVTRNLGSASTVRFKAGGSIEVEQMSR